MLRYLTLTLVAGFFLACIPIYTPAHADSTSFGIKTALIILARGGGHGGGDHDSGDHDSGSSDDAGDSGAGDTDATDTDTSSDDGDDDMEPSPSEEANFCEWPLAPLTLFLYGYLCQE